MAKPIRAFIAVSVRATSSLRKVILELDSMGRALKAVDPGSLHVTLKFLGDTPSESIPRIGAEVQAACEGRLAIDAELHGLGAFPHAGRPSVIWVGMHNVQSLVEISEVLEDGLESLRFPRDSRKFQPHVTLARVKSRPPENLHDLLNANAATSFGSITIDRVTLYQSELRPQGPRYTPLATVSLGAD